MPASSPLIVVPVDGGVPVMVLRFAVCAVEPMYGVTS